MRPFLLSSAACLLLGACSSVVMSTAAMLGMTNLFDVDPAGYEVAVTIPEGVDVSKDGATFGLTNKNTIHNVDIAKTYALQRRDTQDGQTLFRINPKDLAEVREFQAQVKAWELEDANANSGSFTVEVNFCVLGDGPVPEDVFSVAIRTDPDGRFMPLIRNASVSDAIKAIEEDGLDMDTFSGCGQ